MLQPKITIAIDGYAACGKSTLAKALAKKLNYIYIDSGAMYRAVTLYFIQNNINIDDHSAIAQSLDSIQISFQLIDGNNCTFLNGINVESEIRSIRVSDLVSPVATLSIVRSFLVERQQNFGLEGGICMDGRDIGTVVFKKAELKLFLTASIEERTDRRMNEFKAKGILEYNRNQIMENLMQRDHIDSSREDSPLTKASDAIEIDNTDLSPEQQLNMAYDLAVKTINKKAKFQREIN